MSAKINLLPDVRQAKIREKNYRRLAITMASGVLIVCTGIAIVTFLIIQGQNLRISQLTGSIKNKKQQVASFPNVKAILSLQARVEALPKLYSNRVYMTKLANILSTTEPNDVAFTNLAITGGNQIAITANGKSYLAAARIARALQQSTVSAGVSTFTNVTLSTVTQNTNVTTYTITAGISPEATDGK